MAQSDNTLPRYVDLSKLNPVRKFTCDQHGERKIIQQFNPPPSNAQDQLPDITRLRCLDCVEEAIPQRLRSVE